MGTIDSNRFKVTCPKCGAIESVAVHEKGSAYGASWQSGPELKAFKVQWEDKGSSGPFVVSAQCRVCAISATIVGP
jgi:endogenous inhibitor of DNA gyrase (YacG/DUF329 family)